MAMRPSKPVFLEQESYRRRRVSDAARLIPIMGGFLIMLPVIWPNEGEAQISTVSAYVYVFGIWLFMVGAAGLLGFLLRQKKKR